MRRFAMWLFDNVPLGNLAPWVFGFAINSKPHKVETKKEDDHADRNPSEPVE